MNWNGVYSLYTTNGLKQAWDKGTGTSGDINLILVSFLKELGFQAYPVALSTRGNGIIPVSHPSINGFNYVVAMVVVDGKKVLLDATEHFAGVNQLPERCLNDNGRVIDKTQSEWINLSQNASSYQMIFGNLSLDTEGKFKGSIDINETGYAAWNRRNSRRKHNNHDAFVEEIEKGYKGIEISDLEISGVDSINNILKSKFKVTLDSKADLIGNMVVFKPLLVFSNNESPFKLEKRDYPVEFPYPARWRVILTLNIPTEYVVESLPTPVKVVAEDKSFMFTFSTSQMGQAIQVVHDFSISKTLFLPNEYLGIKGIFESIVNKHNEKIVLKRVDI